MTSRCGFLCVLLLCFVRTRRGLIVGSVTVDCRKSSSSWSDVENEPSRQRHHQQHRATPAPLLEDEEAINKDNAKVLQHGARIGMLQQQHGEQQQQTDNERKLLQEERRRIEEAQRQLSLEKEKLARERQQLEVCHRLRTACRYNNSRRRRRRCRHNFISAINDT